MTLERSTRARLTTAVVLLMVLGSGMALGFALDRQVGKGSENVGEAMGAGDSSGTDWRGRSSDPRRGAANRTSRAPGDTLQRRPPMFVDQVGLTDVQREQVDSIVRFHGARMRALHEEFDRMFTPRYREITEATQEDIRAVLTAEQLMAYDSILADRDERRDERRRDSVPGRGEPGGTF